MGEKMDTSSGSPAKQPKADGDAAVEAMDTAPAKDVEVVSLGRIREQIRLLEVGESAKDASYVHRVLRQLHSTRKALSDGVLGRLAHAVLPNSEALPGLVGLLDRARLPSRETMDTDRKAELKSSRSAAQLKKAAAAPGGDGKSVGGVGEAGPEVEFYVHLLFVVFLLDRQRLDDADACVQSLVERLEKEGGGRRSLSALSAKVYFYHALVREQQGRLSALRPWLHQRLTLATLRREEEVEAVLINVLLRSYLTEHLFQPALKLVAKVRFPESAGSNEWARHLYYLGAMRTMECRYEEAHKCLKEALAKAPKDTAIGFKQRVTKALVVVELLEAAGFPERALFRQKEMRGTLAPYLRLTKAVRIGDVAEFDAAIEDNKEQLDKDGTLAWIDRLRSKVVGTALRMISVAYSRISIEQVREALRLPSNDDTEFLLSKAINEGDLEARINHAEGVLELSESGEVYSTGAPSALLHSRTAFCLQLHQAAVKAMRFPPKSYQTQLQSAEEQRQREAAELELAKEMEEEDDF